MTPPLDNTPTPLRKRKQTDPPNCVTALQGADEYMAFYVLSNSTSAYRQDVDDAPTIGPLGFYGMPQDSNTARIIQLAWGFAAPGKVPSRITERYVAIPGVVEGDALGDVLLEFSDAHMHAATPRLRLMSYNMENNAGILLAEMDRCKLHYGRKHLERVVRTRGFDLMDPSMYAWLRGGGGQPAFPALQDIAHNMPPGQRGFPEFRTAGDEVALYLYFAANLREMGKSECQRSGHEPMRVSRGGMRDNGEYCHDCRICGAHLD
jgi:hypothetical protein